jgi:ribonuclease P protein component
MLAKIHRFHKLGSLNYVYRKGKIIRSSYCSMRFARGKHDFYRIAVVVNKKVAKSAVVRNRIRRRVYEAIRLQADGLLTNQDIVVTIFDDRFLDTPYQELAASIKNQLDQIAKSTA